MARPASGRGFILVGVVFVLYLAWQLFQSHRSDGFPFSPGPFIESLIFAAVVLVPIGVRWGRYRRLAPPGPVFVSAADDEWQEAVSTLIRRAHSIVLLLPPGQEIRESFRWEIDQLTQRGLQSRVTIVLPPDQLYRHDFPRRFHDACIVAAALEGFAGSIDDVDPMKVHDLEVSIHARAHLQR